MDKKLKKYLLIFSTVLISGCAGGGVTSSISSSPSSEFPPEEQYEEPILQEDTNTNYTFDDSISNKDGSMCYEIFVRSFYDTDNDGIGDMLGVKEKIPYLADLGIKTLWLMPIHPSPSYHGYDVKNYYQVNPDYGTLDDFDALVEEAAKYNVDIMLDMVFNHCSRENPYFVESYNDFKMGKEGEDSKADWFTWSTKGGYNNCNSSYKNDPEAWYEARFDATMPDFNFDNPQVRAEIENIMKFWIVDHGVKGFRLDAVKYFYYEDTTRNAEVLSWLEETAKKYDEDFYMVGECWSSAVAVNNYHASSLDSFFRFEASYGGKQGSNTITNAAKGRTKASVFINEVVKNVNTIKSRNPNAYPSYFQSNHDMDRVAKAYTSVEQEKAAASLLGMLPGTSYLYYGEEISMLGTRKTSPDDYSDSRRRLPMIWDKEDKTGECDFPEKNRLDLSNNDQVELGVNDRLEENYSLLNHYKKVINVRNKYGDLFKYATVTSKIDGLNVDEKYKNNVYAYELSYNGEKILIVHNFADKNIKCTIENSEILDSINTTRRVPEYSNNTLVLGAHSTVIMK